MVATVCAQHSAVLERMAAQAEAMRMVQVELVRMRKTLNWLSIAIGAMALSGLGSDGIALLVEAAKVAQ